MSRVKGTTRPDNYEKEGECLNWDLDEMVQSMAGVVMADRCCRRDAGKCSSEVKGLVTGL